MDSLEQAFIYLVSEVKELLLGAFVQGAKWWEWESTRATMWQSDQNKAFEEAKRREQNGTLKLDPVSIKPVPMYYDPAFGDDKKCKCGHSYYRHFDTAVGCIYCPCRNFEEVK
jgi:hypothetical protein